MRMTSPTSKAKEFYALGAELKMAFDWHTETHHSRLSATHPLKFDDVAWDFPNLKMIFEHMGGRTYFEDFLAILTNQDAKYPRLFAGVTSVLSKENNRFWYLGPEKILDIAEFAGADKMIFGLDFPWNSKEVNKNDIQTILSLPLKSGENGKILGGNLLSILN